MRSSRRGFGSLLLLVVALTGGPGLTLSEGWEHAHRTVVGHGHRIHFEGRGAQDHDDRCQLGLTRAPSRSPVALSARVRLPAPCALAHLPQFVPASLRLDAVLPFSRAPPAVR